MKAVDLLSPTDLGDVGDFWQSQLALLRALISDAAPAESRWRALIPTEFRPSARNLRLSAFLSMVLQCGLGGRRWRRRFIYGSELAGALSQEGVFPVDHRTARRRPASTGKLFRRRFIAFAIGLLSLAGPMESFSGMNH